MAVSGHYSKLVSEVCFGSNLDLHAPKRQVRFAPINGHRVSLARHVRNV